MFLAGFVFALLCFVALNAAMVPVSKSEYCGSKCHEMNTAYLTWELSPHGSNSKGIRVECIDCHLPEKEKYFAHITAKAYALIITPIDKENGLIISGNNRSALTYYLTPE